MTMNINQNDIVYYTSQDIYDNTGLLLLKKGQKITPRVRKKLKNYGINNLEKYAYTYDNYVVLASKERQSAILNPETIIKEFSERLNIADNNFMNKANEILIDIIFESKTKPWWIYVNTLSKYVDWIYTHSIDVSMISLMMAIELGYNDDDLKNLGIGTILHDVGRLLIPKSIIQKPRDLTESEMEIVKQHCELGMCSLKGYNLPKEYMDVIGQHHERLDGSGYPKGLKEDEISHNAKIAIVADSVDSITFYRPGREAQSMETAINKLRTEKERYPQDLVSILEKVMSHPYLC